MADEQDRLRIQREAEAKAKAVTPEETRQARMDELKAEREKRMVEEAKARAASDPLKDPTNRPEAPQLDDGYIRYYSWIGGVTTGEWRLYKEKKDSPKAASAEARSEGGATQAQFGSSAGANALATGTTGLSGTSSTVKDPYAGLTPEQIEARKNAEELAARLGLSIDPNTGMIIKPPVNFVIDPVTGKYTDPSKLSKPADTTGYKVVNGVLQFNGQPFTGTYNGQTYENGIVKSATDTTGYKVVNGVLLFNGQPFSGTYGGQIYENGKVKVVTDNSGNGGNGGNTNTGYQEVDGVLLFNGKAFTGTFAGTVYENGVKKVTTATTTLAAEKLAERQSAFDLLRAEMDALGLGALVEPLRGLIQKDVSAAEFAIQLRQSEAYKARFAANEGRLKKGLRVLTPGEYLRVEDAYRQTLRTYGLKQFDNDQYVRQFIENDISAAELSDRVATAVQRVQNADPAIGRTLRDYYGIGQTDLVAYVLDPNQQLQKIQRQVAAAEIGTAARRQGLEAGVTVSEQLAAQGISEAQAQRGYATIADILPTSEKLSQIYGTTLEGYDQAQAEQEVFNQLASAQRKRQRLVSREIAEFSGQSGVGRGSLGTATGGQY
jgi:hypothetical protein